MTECFSATRRYLNECEGEKEAMKRHRGGREREREREKSESEYVSKKLLTREEVIAMEME
jgi:hypothetical protein